MVTAQDMKKKYPLLVATEDNQALLQNNDRCDKYDYLVAVACGVIGGIIDIFLVGMPKDSLLQEVSDQQFDNAVKKFAKMTGWQPSEDKQDSVASAIGHLEKTFRINYDHRHTPDTDGLISGMSTQNHHLKSLGHSPDIIGLFFSVLNQFTATASFIDCGHIVTITADTQELQGHNLVAKLFCGIANWFGHIMSDIAGSSGSRGGAGRGMGVPAPFYELFQFCRFGQFNVGQDKQDLAVIAERAFKEGYDARFAVTEAIPVAITELSIRLVWALRRRFQYGLPVKQCFLPRGQETLQVMLIFGEGTLCLMDGVDALIRGQGNALLVFMRLNLVGWLRLISLVLKEVYTRCGIAIALQKQLDAYKKINFALENYLQELEKLDIERFCEETERYNQLVAAFDQVDTTEGLNVFLRNTYTELGLVLPWEGDFDQHMANKNGMLVFR